METYKTISKQDKAELVEKKSRFIAYVKPVQTEEAAIEFIEEIKTKHWDARHNVYAYVIKDGNISRYSDDGEPHGTAGVPVLNILKNLDIVNSAVVVTRYFGGILLGTGGLVRAYSRSAQMAVNKAGISEMVMCFNCSLSCTYERYGKILNLISEVGGEVEVTDFSDQVNLKFHIAEDQLMGLEKKVSEATSGQVKVQILGNTFASNKALPTNTF